MNNPVDGRNYLKRALRINAYLYAALNRLLPESEKERFQGEIDADTAVTYGLKMGLRQKQVTRLRGIPDGEPRLEELERMLRMKMFVLRLKGDPRALPVRPAFPCPRSFLPSPRLA